MPYDGVNFPSNKGIVKAVSVFPDLMGNRNGNIPFFLVKSGAQWETVVFIVMDLGTNSHMVNDY